MVLGSRGREPAPHRGAGSPAYVASDGRESGRLHLVELCLVDRSVVEQRLRRGDLVGTGTAATRGDHRADVLGLLLLHLLRLLDGALRHATAAGDQVGKDAEEGQKDDEQAPKGLGAAPHVTASEDVAEDVEQTHDPCEKDEELEHCEQERPVVVEHLTSSYVWLLTTGPSRTGRRIERDSASAGARGIPVCMRPRVRV